MVETGISPFLEDLIDRLYSADECDIDYFCEMCRFGKDEDVLEFIRFIHSMDDCHFNHCSILTYIYTEYDLLSDAVNDELGKLLGLE